MYALPNLVEDNEIFPTLAKLAECLCSELGKLNGPSLCYCGLMVGDIMPLDLMGCDRGGDCGVAWVRPELSFPSMIFPAPDGGEGSCTAPLAVQVEVGVSRCYPTSTSREALLDPQIYYNTLRLYMADMQAMRRAISCCLDSKDFYGSYSLGQFTPVPAQGGVSGGTWSVTIRPLA